MIRPSLLVGALAVTVFAAGDVRAMPSNDSGAPRERPPALPCFWRRAAAVGTGIAPAAALTLPRELFRKIRAIRAANIRRG